jgi:hypothetical protein
MTYNIIWNHLWVSVTKKVLLEVSNQLIEQIASQTDNSNWDTICHHVVKHMKETYDN